MRAVSPGRRPGEQADDEVTFWRLHDIVVLQYLYIDPIVSMAMDYHLWSPHGIGVYIQM